MTEAKSKLLREIARMLSYAKTNEEVAEAVWAVLRFCAPDQWELKDKPS